MKTIPPIGARVKFKGSNTWSERTCSGKVVAIYKGGYPNEDPETGEKWLTPDHVAVEVDEPLPSWWPYKDTNRFAPEVAEIELDH